MNDIIEFLKARLDDEDYVVALVRDGRREWDHIARHDPSRVLASVAANRTLVAMHEPSEYDHYDRLDSETKQWVESPYCGTCDVCRSCFPDEDRPWPCDTLKLLASVYASHPDYRTEWAVE